MNDSTFAAAREFIYREARLLERRLFACLFENAPPAGVLDALRGYRNEDGGFGHGLEPDKLCPASQPIDVECALQIMDAVGAVDETLVHAACDFLAAVSSDGSVPLAFPSIEGFPRAQHWSEWTYERSVFPTAGIAGLLHKLGVSHPWLDAATAYCWSSLEHALPTDAHALADVLVFLEHAPDRRRANVIVAAVASQLPQATWMRIDSDDPAYGVTPLHLAPAPASRWRTLFEDDVIRAHLDSLLADQQPDGGWPLRWEPPSQAATLAWRGMETLRALRALDAYDRLPRR